MVKVNKTSLLYRGVALSNLTIDNLRSFESELTNDIIVQNNALAHAKKYNLKTVVSWCVSYIEMFEQQRTIVQAEINARYALMRV